MCSRDRTRTYNLPTRGLGARLDLKTGSCPHRADPCLPRRGRCGEARWLWEHGEGS
jgi:hypothetical protein